MFKLIVLVVGILQLNIPLVIASDDNEMITDQEWALVHRAAKLINRKSISESESAELENLIFQISSNGPASQEILIDEIRFPYHKTYDENTSYKNSTEHRNKVLQLATHAAFDVGAMSDLNVKILINELQQLDADNLESKKRIADEIAKHDPTKLIRQIYYFNQIEDYIVDLFMENSTLIDPSELTEFKSDLAINIISQKNPKAITKLIEYGLMLEQQTRHEGTNLGCYLFNEEMEYIYEAETVEEAKDSRDSILEIFETFGAQPSNFTCDNVDVTTALNEYYSEVVALLNEDYEYREEVKQKRKSSSLSNFFENNILIPNTHIDFKDISLSFIVRTYGKCQGSSAISSSSILYSIQSVAHKMKKSNFSPGTLFIDSYGEGDCTRTILARREKTKSGKSLEEVIK